MKIGDRVQLHDGGMADFDRNRTYVAERHAIRDEFAIVIAFGEYGGETVAMRAESDRAILVRMKVYVKEVSSASPLDYARASYPIGTKYISPKSEKVVEVRKNDHYIVGMGDDIGVSIIPQWEVSNGLSYVYYCGKWGKILPPDAGIKVSAPVPPTSPTNGKIEPLPSEIIVKKSKKKNKLICQ